MRMAIPILTALLLTTFVAVPASAAGGSCPTDTADVDVAGALYVHTASGGNHDGESFVYLETNGITGLQYGAEHSLFGWSEMDGIRSPCKDGDMLVV